MPDNPIFILHIIIGLSVGGAETALAKLVRATRENKSRRTHIISLTDIGPIGQQLLAEGVTIDQLGLMGWRNLPLVFWRLRNKIKALQPDIVQTWLYHADFLGGLAARTTGLHRIIWSVRSSDIAKGGAKATLVIRKACAMMSDFVPQKIVYVGHYSKQVHESIGYSQSKALVIPNGFDPKVAEICPDASQELRRQLTNDRQDILIGFVGRCHHVKGPDLFVSAVGELLEDYPHVVPVLVGRGMTSDNLKLQSWLNATGRPDAFCLLGERRDVPTLMAAFDIFCLSSRSEGFPNVLGEAMSAKTACVSTDVGDAPDMIGEFGLVTDRENVPALSEALRKLIECPNRAQLGIAAQARIRGKFSLQNTLLSYENLYKMMMDPK